MISAECHVLSALHTLWVLPTSKEPSSLFSLLLSTFFDSCGISGAFAVAAAVFSLASFDDALARTMVPLQKFSSLGEAAQVVVPLVVVVVQAQKAKQKQRSSSNGFNNNVTLSVVPTD
jgi:hypothetical protein